MKKIKSDNQRINYLFPFLVLVLISCNAGSLPESDQSKQVANQDSILNSEQPTSHCYLYTNKKDSIKLNYTQNKDNVKGNLHFQNYQIDGSRGTINGQFHGDTLWIEYDFMAEGMHSNTEEVFLKKGDSLIRGVGEHIISADRSQFKNRDSIRFQDGQIFLPVACN